MKKRIWELDAARGLALIGMILIHFVFDLTELTGILTWQEPGWFLFLKNHGGALFLVISGISATLGSHLRNAVYGGDLRNVPAGLCLSKHHYLFWCIAMPGGVYAAVVPLAAV